jgi:hypothetical protein
MEKGIQMNITYEQILSWVNQLSTYQKIKLIEKVGIKKNNSKLLSDSNVIDKGDTIKWTPIVNSLKGSFKSFETLNYKKERATGLEKKYL